MGKYIIGITGASGAIYADRLIRQLLKYGHKVMLVMTEAGRTVFSQELNLDFDGMDSKEVENCLGAYFDTESQTGIIIYFDNENIGASLASGSFHTDGMIVVPCSMATVSALAHGASGNLLERAADVIIKEKRTLIIVPREAPLSSIHLHNLLLLSQCNVTIIPAAPSFYHKPESLEELVDYFVGRILDQLDVQHDYSRPWTGI